MATTLDDVLKQVNDLTILVNSITTASENIEDFPLLDPINDGAELPATFNGADYKVNVSQLVKDYLEGLNISIENDTISTVLDPDFNELNLLTASTPIYQAGRFWFDGTNFNFYDNIENTSIQLGKELVLDVRNDNGALLDNLTVVRYDSAIGGVPSVVRAQADTVANCRDVAVVTHDIAVGEVGKAVFNGLAGGDTSAFSVDDRLYVSATNAGELTNVEQPILSYVGIVLISDATNGLVLVNPTGIRNITAVGQSTGSNRTQDLTTIPQSITAYENNSFEANVTITHTGTTNLTTAMSPSSIGASGYYDIFFNVALTSTSNDLLTFEVYKNGVATGISSVIDLRNNNIDAGSCSLSGVTQSAPLLETDSIEIYAYNDGGTSSVTYTSCLVKMNRLGNY